MLDRFRMFEHLSAVQTAFEETMVADQESSKSAAEGSRGTHVAGYSREEAWSVGMPCPREGADQSAILLLSPVVGSGPQFGHHDARGAAAPYSASCCSLSINGQ